MQYFHLKQIAQVVFLIPIRKLSNSFVFVHHLYMLLVWTTKLPTFNTRMGLVDQIFIKQTHCSFEVW